MKYIYHSLLLYCMLCCISAASAQTFTEYNLKKTGNHRPFFHMVFNNKLIFTTYDSNASQQLWISDGSVSGTKLLKDLDSTSKSQEVPSRFTKYYNKLFFRANAGGKQFGTQPCVTDGTTSGTYKLPNSCTNGCNTNPTNFIVYSGKLLFFAGAGNNGNGTALWSTDGTLSGTQVLKMIYTSWYTDKAGFTIVNGRLCFAADDGVNGIQLWVTDGTAAGTNMLKNIYPNSSAEVSSLSLLNNKILFVANDGVNGPELWMTDGTTSGTQLVKDIYPGSTGSDIQFIGVCNNKMFFYANDIAHGKELWTTDGTTAGTQIVSDICPGPSDGIYYSNFWPSYNPIIVNNQLYFMATDCNAGYELWVTDGTNTNMVKDINPGNGDSDPNYFIALNGSVFFNADDGTHGEELWVTDGTTMGTHMVQDIVPGTLSSKPSNKIAYHNKIYFTSTPTGLLNNRLFQTDGTDTGTIMLMPKGSVEPNPLDAYSFTGFTEYQNKLFFGASFFPDGRGELWSFQDTTIIDTTLSVKRNNAQFQTSVYPNPAGTNDIISVEYTVAEAGNVTVKLADLMGKVVAIINSSNETAGKQRIKFSASDYHLPAGMYSLQLTTVEGSVVQKINIL